MNGREIENLLSAIDESIVAGRQSVRAEILRYLLDHEQDVLISLRKNSMVTVPTSAGNVELLLPQLQELVA